MKGGSTMQSIILTEEQVYRFCKELGIESSKILIKIDGNHASYYADDEKYHDLDLEVAKKYM